MIHADSRIASNQMIAFIPLFLSTALSAIAAQDPVAPHAQAALVQKSTIELPKVEGRIDHVAIDLTRERAYLAALGNDSIEAIDLKAGKHLQSMPSPGEPQGIVYLAESDRLVVASGKAGTCDVYDGTSLKAVTSVVVGDDADNLRYDARQKRLYVGYGSGAIAVVDATTWKVLERIPLDGHPESFQFSSEDSRMFVNVPEAHQVAVLDLAAHKVLAKWKVDEAGANFPMALIAGSQPDENCIALGCRSPATLALRSTATGKSLGALQLSGDTDDLFWDSQRQRVYAICGEGVVDVFVRTAAGFERSLRVPTAPGARTGLFVPERNELIVAVPHRGSQRAEVRLFQVTDAK